MLYKFNILFLLSYLNCKTMSISSLSNSCTVQHTINNSYTYSYSLYIYIYTSVYFIEFLSIMLAIFACYIMLVLCSMLLISYYVQNYAGIIGSTLSGDHASLVCLICPQGHENILATYFEMKCYRDMELLLVTYFPIITWAPIDSCRCQERVGPVNHARPYFLLALTTLAYNASDNAL